MNGKIGIAVIGAGKFARWSYLPEIVRMDSLSLKAIVNRTEESAQRVCNEFLSEYHTTDLDRVLKDPQIDLVLIATRHELHKDQAIAAARAGKHMILEKPMALTIEDAIDIAREVQRSGVKFVLGFNRRFSSHTERLRSMVAQTGRPVMVMQRWQEPPLPSDFWHYDPVRGRGRILGMAIHLMDFMCFLLDSRPVEVYCNGGALRDRRRTTEDTTSIVLRFPCDTIATIVHGDYGAGSFSNERVEVYLSGQVAVIEDFESFQIYENERCTSETYTDLGYRGTLESMLAAIGEEKPLPIDVNDGIASMVLFEACRESIKDKKAVFPEFERYLI